MVLGSSLMSNGMVCASLPDGLTLPNSTSASAGPPDWPSSPGFEDALGVLGPRCHGDDGAVGGTTTTFLFSVATASSSAICLAGMSRVSRSKPSDSAASGSPRNMSTTSAPLAASTASASSAGSAGSRSRVKPGANLASTPRSVRVSRKLVILVGVMCEEPPP